MLSLADLTIGKYMANNKDVHTVSRQVLSQFLSKYGIQTLNSCQFMVYEFLFAYLHLIAVCYL